MDTTTDRVNAHVRGIPADLWTAVKMEAIRRNRTVGAIVADALRAYLPKPAPGSK